MSGSILPNLEEMGESANNDDKNLFVWDQTLLGKELGDIDNPILVSCDPNDPPAKNIQSSWLNDSSEFYPELIKKRDLKGGSKLLEEVSQDVFHLEEENKDSVQTPAWSKNDEQTKGLSSVQEPDPKGDSKRKRKRTTTSERVKKSRERKEKYYKDLEIKVAHLEQKWESLVKEVADYKAKLSAYENLENTTDSSNPHCLDSKFFDVARKKIQEINEGDISIVKVFEEIGRRYGPFGQEKLKVLESSFDCFFENILSGSGIKIAFYACEDFPKNYTEYKKYLKLKKYQQHELYPNPHLR